MLVAMMTRARRRRAQRQILLVGVERAVQRHDFDAGAGLVLQLGDRTADLGCAWQEAQHLPVSGAHHLDRGVGDRLA